MALLGIAYQADAVGHAAVLVVQTACAAPDAAVVDGELADDGRLVGDDDLVFARLTAVFGILLLRVGTGVGGPEVGAVALADEEVLVGAEVGVATAHDGVESRAATREEGGADALSAPGVHASGFVG